MADIQTLKAELEANNDAVKAQLAELAQLKAELLAARPVARDGVSRDDLVAALKMATEPTTALVRKLKPENAEARKLGPFEHPDGGEEHPKPDILTKDGGTVEIFFGCKDSNDTRAMLRCRKDEHTYFEWVALKTLYDSLGKGQRRTCRDGKWKVLVSEFGDTMHMLVPIKNPDDRADLPPLLGIITELTSGDRMPDSQTLMEQLALMRQELDALKAAAV